MLVSFAKEETEVPNITVHGIPISRVTECKLLGIELNHKLSWHSHVDKMYKKGSSWLQFVNKLKKTKMPTSDIVKVYTTLVRHLLEYASHVWHSGWMNSKKTWLSQYKREPWKWLTPHLLMRGCWLSATFKPSMQGDIVFVKNLFLVLKEPDHKLHHVLTPKRKVHYESKYRKPYTLPKVKTNRFKDSFISYCLFNF